VLRTTRSETIFRTEGTGEPLCREAIDDGMGSVDRIVITKRKQVAVERRTGREILRREGLLFPRKEATELLCSLNTNDPCERCVDCWLYGFAAGGGGAQRSRVLTEDAFSLLPANEIVDTRTFNATFENGTMRNPETAEPSQALGESEYVRPGSHFLDIEVLRDVTEAELAYVLGNIFRSTRYGATSSRVGRVDNELLAVAFSDQELDSTLSWLRASVGMLREEGIALRHPISDDIAKNAAQKGLSKLAGHAMGRVDWLLNTEALRHEVARLWDDPAPWLKGLSSAYPAPEVKVKAPKKKG
jgi:CRISPR-associated protein Csc2